MNSGASKPPVRPDASDGAHAWEAEIAQRLHQLESGEAHTVDAEEALRKIDARIRMQPQESS